MEVTSSQHKSQQTLASLATMPRPTQRTRFFCRDGHDSAKRKTRSSDYRNETGWGDRRARQSANLDFIRDQKISKFPT